MWTGVLHVSPVALRGGAMYVMVGLVAAYFAYLLLFAGLTTAERRASSCCWCWCWPARVLGRLRTGRLVAHIFSPSATPTG